MGGWRDCGFITHILSVSPGTNPAMTFNPLTSIFPLYSPLKVKPNCSVNQMAWVLLRKKIKNYFKIRNQQEEMYILCFLVS